MDCGCGKSKGGLCASAVVLKDVVEYSDGSVVSRVLLENEAGSLTAFAFDRGQGLSEHSAPFDALVQILDGEAEIVIGGEVNSVKEGQIILMPANVPHALKSVTRFKMLLTMLKAK